jgi:GR25 family glycosyltransferase involved in LPS biosynthesis
MKFLDFIVFINLEHRHDRLAEITSELEKMELQARRFNAIKHHLGYVGCSQSHLAVLKMALDNDWPYVLILEDDFTFEIDKQTLFQQVQSLVEYSNSNPVDVCFFSYNMIKSEPIAGTSDFIKALDCQTTSGYLIMNHYYSKLIELYEWANPILELTQKHWLYACDQCWKVYQPKDNWIAFKNRIGKQRESYSDISECITDYGC